MRDSSDYASAVWQACRLEQLSPDPALDALFALAQSPKTPPTGAGLELIPDWFVRHLAVPAGHDPRSWAARWTASFQQRPSAWLRFARKGKSDGMDCLKRHGVYPAIDPRSPLSGRLDRPLSRALTLEGAMFFHIQDLASQCVGLLAAPTPGDHWWDACAGVGGKTLHLLDLMETSGQITATDIRTGPLDQLKQRVRRAGLANRVTLIKADAREARMKKDYFDGVLVDAPCSGTGTWSRSPDARWRTPERLVLECAAAQERLLRQTAQHVRPGGTLIYSVCTNTLQETTQQTAIFESGHPQFRRAPMRHPLTGDLTDGQAWIYPWDGPCGAMFIARWERRADQRALV